MTKREFWEQVNEISHWCWGGMFIDGTIVEISTAKGVRGIERLISKYRKQKK